MADIETSQRLEAKRQAVIQSISAEVRMRMKDLPPCHDWWHIQRVRKLGAHIARIERADPYIVDLTLLLHDVDDHKFNGGVDSGAMTARDIMDRHQVRSSMVELAVCEIISTMSFKDGKGPPMRTLEGRVVQDADRLDAIGAIGIARAFTTGAHMKRPLYSPLSEPHTVDHFHEKLLLLKKRMNTDEAKRIAKRRHSMLARFLYEFRKEWDLEV